MSRSDVRFEFVTRPPAVHRQDRKRVRAFLLFGLDSVAREATYRRHVACGAIVEPHRDISLPDAEFLEVVLHTALPAVLAPPRRDRLGRRLEAELVPVCLGCLARTTLPVDLEVT